MRKTILSLAILFTMALVANAQADVVNAYSAMENGDYVKAAEYIDKAITNEKAVGKEKTWRYRGQIYMALALDPSMKQQFPNAIKLSTESFLKARELDPNGSYVVDVVRSLQNLRNIAINSGVEDFQTKDYSSAMTKFELSKQIWSIFGLTDTLAIYNGALAADLSGNDEAAIKGYLEAAQLGYNSAESYKSVFLIQKEQGKDDDAFATLKKARELFPQDKALILQETEIYLGKQQYAEAENSLNLAISQDPGNEVLHFALGTVYDNLGKQSEAVAAYTKATEINPGYFDPYYNLGALYFNKAVEAINACQSIPANQQSKYDACVKEANLGMTNSIPYFERALEINPEDMPTMESLRNIYARTGQDAKYDEINKKMTGGQ
jgi:tetratricopeptide (TPR) repeat protein